MEAIGRILFVGGWVVFVLSYLYIVFWSFKVRISSGFFCLIITPIFAFVSSELRNNEKIKPALLVFVISFVLMLSSVLFF